MKNLAISIAVVVVVAVFATCHGLGWRVHTGFLSGTLPADPLDAIRGLVYIASYFAAVLVAPPLLIATGLAAVTRRWQAPTPPSLRG